MMASSYHTAQKQASNDITKLFTEKVFKVPGGLQSRKEGTLGLRPLLLAAFTYHIILPNIMMRRPFGRLRNPGILMFQMVSTP